MGGRFSRRKGADAEREVARIYREHGFDVERVPNSGGLWIPGDLSGVEGFHQEVKRHETLCIPKWIEQAEHDCPEGWVPTVIFRRSRGKTPDRWWAALPFEQGFLPLLRALRASQGVSE